MAPLMPRWLIAVIVAAACVVAVMLAVIVTLVAYDRPAGTDESVVPIRFTGGHDIGPDDFGRPVTLIAAALGVEPDVFRQAFTGVTPARGRGPTGDEARANKQALMAVLAPHGITNERLDEVSNYYRFRPDSGRIWPTRDAVAHAVLDDEGRVETITVTDPGSGYCSLPEVVIVGHEDVALQVTLSFGRDFESNGSVASVEVSP